jgi:hypothetical protein
MNAAPMLEGWGRLRLPGREVLSTDLESATRGAALSRGLGRSYGDSSLPAREADKVVATRLAGRILAFDEATGVVRAEAGLSVAELNRVLIPRGFFPPVYREADAGPRDGEAPGDRRAEGVGSDEVRWRSRSPMGLARALRCRLTAC